MKRALFFAAAFAASAFGADAGVITYTWHQTSTTLPGLVFTAYYQVLEGVAPNHADSTQTSPDFGGLVGLYIEGGGYPAITLSDLIPSCQNSGGCVIGGIDYDYGSPSWWIDVPDFFYLAASSFPGEPFHFEWDYEVSATSIRLGDDNAASPCFEQFGCYAQGFWVASYVPEPMTLLAFAGGLAMLGASLRRRRARP